MIDDNKVWSFIGLGILSLLSIYPDLNLVLINIHVQSRKVEATNDSKHTTKSEADDKGDKIKYVPTSKRNLLSDNGLRWRCCLSSKTKFHSKDKCKMYRIWYSRQLTFKIWSE